MASQEAPRVEVQTGTPGVAIVRLRGEHDISVQPALAEALASASEQWLVLVDLSECSCMDSSVVGVLAVAHQHLHETGGRLEVVLPTDADKVHASLDPDPRFARALRVALASACDSHANTRNKHR